MEQVSSISLKTPQAAPTAQKERIDLLDSLRGIAILGILMMNLPSFGIGAYNPLVNNETGINYFIWYFVELIPDGTQRAIFSMLFGAGVILFLSAKEKNLPGMLPAQYFVRRMLWLIVFSLIDVYLLLWHGDILFDYACMGFILFAFRNLPAKKLLIAAFVCMVFMSVRENRNLYLDKEVIHTGENIAAMDTTITKLSLLQKQKLNEMKDFKEETSIATMRKRFEKSKEIMHSGYSAIYSFRAKRYLDTIVKYTYLELWDILQFMFIGMAFFKMGILTGKAKTKVYAWMCIIGLGVGMGLAHLRLQSIIHLNFNWFEYARQSMFDWYNIDRTFRSLGFFALVMLIYKSGIFKWFFKIMQPTGQMAFTNYLGQSILCAIVFYGFGFGLYGNLQRYEAYLVLLGIWAFQIIFSNLWLRHFNFGPLEWAWRSLTYWKMPVMKK
ncbi:MAG: DUF418 domain-containing protein [Aquaticitalea sp.]